MRVLISAKSFIFPATGKKERYSGVEHGIEDLVDKSKIDIVVQRQVTFA